jgi:hypothetical protein
MSSRASHLHLAGSLQLRMLSCHLHSVAENCYVDVIKRRLLRSGTACSPFHDAHNMKEIFALFQSISSSRVGTGRRRYNEGQAYILFYEREFF